MKWSLLLLLAAFVAACAPAHNSLSADERPIPVLVTTTPRLRTDGDLLRRHKQIVADAARGGHEIAFLGASIVERWTTVGKAQWESVWLPRHSVDCGIGGDRTQDVLGRLDDGLLDALAAPNNHIRWIVMNIGSNNTDTDSPDDIAAGVEAIIARLHARIPDARIVLSLFPRGRWPNPLRDNIIAANTLLASRFPPANPSHVHLQDLSARFVTSSGEIPAELMPDFLHPSPAGYQIWSDELAKIIR